MASSDHPRWVFSVAAALGAIPVAVVLVIFWPFENPATSVNLERAALAASLLLAALLGGALTLLFLAVAETVRGEPPTFESHWGGFGGGLGGWRISPSLAYLLGALLLGGLFGTLVVTGLESDPVRRWLGVSESEASQGTTEPESPPQDEEPDENVPPGSAAGDEGAA